MKKLGELGMNTEHLAPVGTVIGVDPMELSMLKDCEVSLDALNFLRKRMDGMCETKRNQFLTVLTYDEQVDSYGLKDIVNIILQPLAVYIFSAACPLLTVAQYTDYLTDDESLSVGTRL